MFGMMPRWLAGRLDGCMDTWMYGQDDLTLGGFLWPPGPFKFTLNLYLLSSSTGLGCKAAP